MPAYFSTELGGTANQTAIPAGLKPSASVYGARLRRIRATFTYATQTTSDTLVVGVLPTGATVFQVALNTSVSTSTATLALGITGTTGKYRAAAAVTTTDAPQVAMLAARAADSPLTAEETVFLTIGTASLPSSGTLVVDIIYSMP